MGFDYANRLKMLPPYLFAEIEEKVERKRKEGMDIIDFGIGDPDLPTPQPIRSGVILGVGWRERNGDVLQLRLWRRTCLNYRSFQS